jgi:hypothetical protein
MTTIYLNGKAVELTEAEQIAFEATLPKPPPKVDPADNTFQGTAPWPSLTE